MNNLRNEKSKEEGGVPSGLDNEGEREKDVNEGRDETDRGVL